MLPVALEHLDEVPQAIGWVAAQRMLGLYTAGDLAEADEFAAAIEAMIVDDPDPTRRAAVLMYRGMLAADAGRLHDGLRLLRQSAALHEVDNRRGYQSWCLAGIARVEAQLGRLDVAREAAAAAHHHYWPAGQIFAADLALADAWIMALGATAPGPTTTWWPPSVEPSRSRWTWSSPTCATKRSGWGRTRPPTSPRWRGRRRPTRAGGSGRGPTTPPALADADGARLAEVGEAIRRARPAAAGGRGVRGGGGGPSTRRAGRSGGPGGPSAAGWRVGLLGGGDPGPAVGVVAAADATRGRSRPPGGPRRAQQRHRRRAGDLGPHRRDPSAAGLCEARRQPPPRPRALLAPGL